MFAVVISSISVRQRLQRLLLIEYSFGRRRILHLTWWACACSLQFPGELGKLGVVLFAIVLHARLVVGVSFFECHCCGADISHGGASALHGDACFIDHAPGKALSFQRACFFSSSAVAILLSLQILPGCRGAYTGVVAFDECGHVGCAAVADFHCVTFEDFVQLAACWEVLGDQTQEPFSDIGFHILVVRGVVPRDCPLMSSPPALCCWGGSLLLSVSDSLGVATCLQHIVVGRCCSNEGVVIMGDVGQPMPDCRR